MQVLSGDVSEIKARHSESDLGSSERPSASTTRMIERLQVGDRRAIAIGKRGPDGYRFPDPNSVQVHIFPVA